MERSDSKYKEPTTKNDLEVDCISRADARSLVVKIGTKDILGMSGKAFQDLYKGIDNLPSVTPQEPKTGHWIIDVHKIRASGSKNETHDYSVHCDKCNYAWDYTTDKEKSLVSNFCPNCGARMVEPQERSDKK